MNNGDPYEQVTDIVVVNDFQGFDESVKMIQIGNTLYLIEIQGS